MSKVGSSDGLRERKRAVTQATIEHAAVSLALEHGYDQITVDMISEASMVSQRTFFNYFGSKEGVILGPTPPMPSDEAIARFVHGTGSNVLGDFVSLITSSMIGREPDPELFKARRILIQRTPELFSKELVRLGELEAQFAQIVLTRLQEHGRDTATEPDLEDEARMVIALTTGVMHYALRKWFSDEYSGTTQELLDSSIGLIRRITGSEP